MDPSIGGLDQTIDLTPRSDEATHSQDTTLSPPSIVAMPAPETPDEPGRMQPQGEQVALRIHPMKIVELQGYNEGGVLSSMEFTSAESSNTDEWTRVLDRSTREKNQALKELEVMKRKLEQLSAN
ncbi:hypothetical protein Droror1_Dr00027603 [Drosera rotundifolia]